MKLVKIHMVNGKTLNLDKEASNEFLSKSDDITHFSVLNFKNFIIPMNSVIYIETLEERR